MLGRFWLGVLALVLSACAALGSASAQERRVALVIGNGAYQSLHALANPPNDAADVATALEDLGFEVIRGTDLGLSGMQELITRFAAAAADSDVSLFYYAGHGLQLASHNYLVPVDAELRSAADVPANTLQLGTLLDALEGQGGIHLVILDACRNNPLPSTEGADAGLARVGDAAGFLIAFATQPDNVAYDGRGRNSPFAQALLGHMAVPGQDVSSMLISVRQDVISATGGYQIPWENSSLTRQFYFAPGDPTYESPEVMLFQLAGGARDPELMQVYLERYPEGAHVSDVRALLAEIDTGQETATDATEEPVADAAADDEVGDLLWDLARSGRTRSLADLYLARYPEGPHAADARALLESLPSPNDPNAPSTILCERLVTHPRDATANVAGVELAVVAQHAEEAIAACTSAVADEPDQPHYVALLARALAASGDKDAAIERYREAAEGGDLRALVSLGLLTEAGDGVPRDPQGAAELYERAAEGGSPDGAINLAVMLIEGTSLERDTGRAVSLLQTAADAGSPIATYNLGVLSDRGTVGTPTDALGYFRRATELGDARGYVASAILLDEGRGVERDPDAAADALLRGVASDTGEAFNQLTEQARDWSPETIRAVQTRLQEAGYYEGAIDAQSGPMFAAALRQWRLLGPPT